MRPVLALVLICPPSALAATLTVGPTGDHATLQDALDVAADGDTVQVAATEVSGSAVIERAIIIEGQGADRTTLSDPGTVLTIRTSDAVIVRDLAIGGGTGHAIAATDAELTLDGVAIRDRSDSAGGAAVHITGGALDLVDATFERNRAPAAFGGHVRAEGTTVTVRGGTFVQGRAERGGALMVIRGSLDVSDAEFRQNAVRAGEVRGVGGAIATEYAPVRIAGTDLLGNTATEGQGGHISIYRGSGFTLEDSTLRSVDPTPSATEYFGGGVVVFDADTVVRRVAFDGLSVEHSGVDGTYGYGGALFIYGSRDRTFTIEASTFTDNTATGFGGAVRIESGSGVVRDSTFHGNEGDYGGGLHLATDQEVRVEGNEFTDNVARYGAALRWIPPQPDSGGYAGRLELVDNTYRSNVSGNYGGVMYARNGASLLIDGDVAVGNTGTLGGAHMLYSVQEIEVRRGYYCGNRAEGGSNPDGGAVASYLSGADGYIVTNNVFAENRATSWGGGVSMLRDGAATVENNTFLANRAADGGGIAFRGESSTNPMSATFVNNLVGYTAGGDGIGGRDVNLDLNAHGAWFSNVTLHVDEGLEPLNGTHLVDVDPELIAYNPDGDCSNDLPFPAFGSPLVDAGLDLYSDLDGSPSDIGASGGPGADPALWLDADEDGDIALWDCDDDDPDRGPSQAEVANDGVDQDCDGQDLRDGDGDGFDGGADGDDCDDTDPAVYPGAREVVDDGIDQDCDGQDLSAGEPDDPIDPSDPSGCGCATGAAPSPWLLGLPLLLVLRRREGGTR